jgi:tetratricopeptide (TPR) repeat protein
MDNTEGPVAFLYRGEAYRCLGRLDEARDQLLRACELHPTRLSAWINLALVHGAAADHLQQRRVFARIARTAPALLSEAAQEIGADTFDAIVLAGPVGASDTTEPVDGAHLDRVLRHCLEMMRGNRSSSCVTYFTADGALHYVPQRHDAAPVVDAGAEAREIAEIRDLVVRALQPR